jgi:hypothetical protein
MQIVVIGRPGDVRIIGLQTALRELGMRPAVLVMYADWLAGRVHLDDVLTPDSILRIESPDRDFATERALLQLGATIDDPEGTYRRFSREALDALTDDKGALRPSRQWYLGYCEALRRIEAERGACRVMNLPNEIALMFDKRATHAALNAAGISVPPAFEPIDSYAALLSQMRARDCYRVFIKLAHGSSASGAVAYRTNGHQHQAISTVEMVETHGTLKLYNTRQIKTYTDMPTIVRLIDALCRDRVHVEAWLPKADRPGGVFDLRVVMISGRARQIVMRQGPGPMTNLHLLNKRGDVDALRTVIGPERWNDMLALCERAVAPFKSLYCGLDVIFTAGYHWVGILEMNAFGDLLPGIVDRGEDTYRAELQALRA